MDVQSYSRQEVTSAVSVQVSFNHLNHSYVPNLTEITTGHKAESLTQNHNSNLLFRTMPTKPMSCVGACELRSWKLHPAVSSNALGNIHPP